MWLEEVEDEELGSLNRKKQKKIGWEVMMIDSEEESIGGSEGSNWATNKQWNSATDPQPFVNEMVQSR